jgi:hypothetical protein
MISCLSSFFFSFKEGSVLTIHGIIVTLSSGEELAPSLDECETAYGGIKGQDFAE